ncbi:cell division protein FtsZ, partial [Candidatus Acetothermia bacterium]
LLNITGGEDLTLAEVTQIAEVVRKQIALDADLTFGAVVRGELQGKVKVTVIPADFKSTSFEEEAPPRGPSVPRPPRRKVEIDKEDVDIPAFLRRNREE